MPLLFVFFFIQVAREISARRLTQLDYGTWNAKVVKNSKVFMVW